MWAKNLTQSNTSARQPSPAQRAPSTWETQLRARVHLSQQALHATLLGYALAGMPADLKQQQASKARSLWGDIYIDAFYKGDAVRCAEDNAFYADGAALVARDFQRKGHLLLRPPSVAPANGTTSTPGEEAVRAQLQQDAWSLLLFSLLAMNTFPLTPAVVSWLLRHAPWLPRKWLLPSQFEQRRLDGLRRARALGQGKLTQGKVASIV